MCVFICVFRGDVTGQRDAAPLQANGLPGPPAAPHGHSRGQEGGLTLVGCDAQGRTCRICWGESRHVCVLPPPRPVIVLCINLLFVPTRRPNCCMSPGTSDAPAVSATLNLKAAQPKCFFLNASSDSDSSSVLDTSSFHGIFCKKCFYQIYDLCNQNIMFTTSAQIVLLIFLRGRVL